MASRHRLFVVSSALLALVTLGPLPAGAQSSTTNSDLATQQELGALIERLEQQDRKAVSPGGVLLERSKNARQEETRLSIGKVEDGTDRPFSLDPAYDPDPLPGIGFNLEMNF